MPNYPTHARWGRIGAVVAALGLGAGLFTLFDSPLLAGGGALGAATATFVGAIFPDIDHHKSIPRRKAVRGLSLLVVFGVGALAALNFEVLVGLADTAVSDLLDDPGVPPEILAGVGVAGVALVAAGLVDPAVDLVTVRHRGWTHNPLAMLALTAVLAGLIWLSTAGLSTARQVTAVGVVGTFFCGSLIHLGLDGEIR